MTPLGALVDPLVNCRNAKSDGLISMVGSDSVEFLLMESVTIQDRSSGHGVEDLPNERKFSLSAGNYLKSNVGRRKLISK